MIRENFYFISCCVIFLTIQYRITAQTHIVLNTQDDVDNIYINHPLPNSAWTSGQVSISISSNRSNEPQISNVENLYKIQKLDKFDVQSSSKLPHFKGLHNLEKANEISIAFSGGMKNLEGLSSLQEVSKFTMRATRDFVTLDGVHENLKVTEQIHISGNIALRDFKSIVNTDTLSSLFIKNNTEIHDLSSMVNVSHIDGDLDISGESFSSFKGLDNLKSIKGTLRIQSADDSFNFNGLRNLETLGSLDIDECDGFTNFVGLGRLKQIKNQFELSRNRYLTSFEGINPDIEFCGNKFELTYNAMLEDLSAIENANWDIDNMSIEWSYNLTEIPLFRNLRSITDKLLIHGNKNLGSFEFLGNLEKLTSIAIIDNNNLQNLKGLEHLNNLKYIDIQDNVNLSSLQGINSKALIAAHSIDIRRNENLSKCSVDEFCLLCFDDTRQVRQSINISENGMDCNTYEEVHINCMNRLDDIDLPDTYKLKQPTLKKKVLVDERDKHAYPIIKLNGLLWMNKNLQFSAIHSYQNRLLEKTSRFYYRTNAERSCPIGWRLPTQSEWQSLSKRQEKKLNIEYQGKYTRGSGNEKDGIGVRSYFWSLDDDDKGRDWFEFNRDNQEKTNDSNTTRGLSVRCVSEIK